MSNRVAGDELRQFIERIERMNAEKQDIAEATKVAETIAAMTRRRPATLTMKFHFKAAP